MGHRESKESPGKDNTVLAQEVVLSPHSLGRGQGECSVTLGAPGHGKCLVFLDKPLITAINILWEREKREEETDSWRTFAKHPGICSNLCPIFSPYRGLKIILGWDRYSQPPPRGCPLK